MSASPIYSFSLCKFAAGVLVKDLTICYCSIVVAIVMLTRPTSRHILHCSRRPAAGNEETKQIHLRKGRANAVLDFLECPKFCSAPAR
jgi:hypothetical protein